MAVLPLVIAPDPLLKCVSHPVEKVDDQIRQELDDMLETMYASGGIGLAAVQVGWLKRMLVVDVEQREEDGHRNPIFLINPEIVSNSEEPFKYKEGCLSFPDQYADVERPKEITVKYLDRNGKAQELQASGLLATCIQHEIDHLNGVVFVDHLSRLKRDTIMRKMEKAQKLGLYHHVHDEHCNH